VATKKPRPVPSLFQDIKDCDLVIETRDIRLPLSSQVGFLQKRFNSKNRVIFLTKADMAGEDYRRQVRSYFCAQGIEVFEIASNHRQVRLQALFKTLSRRFTPSKSKLGVLRVVIVGYPNVGKSTLINRIRGKASAKAANRPGVTRGRQWIKISPKCYLLDTPGVATLTHYAGDREARMKYACCRMISQGEVGLEDVARYLHSQIIKSGVWTVEDSRKFLDFESDFDAFSRKIALRFQCLTQGGEPDLERVSRRYFEFVEKTVLPRLDLDELASLLVDYSEPCEGTPEVLS
jgi:ribosome biogenesis GTPase A